MPITTTPSGGPQGEFSTYTPIYSQTISSATATVTFSNIPQTYTDIVIIMNVKMDTLNQYPRIRFNSDTSSSYGDRTLYGNGSSAVAGVDTSVSGSGYIMAATYVGTSDFDWNCKLELLNYSNTTNHKTFLVRANRSAVGVDLVYGLWRKTEPITRIDLVANSGNYSAGSTFTLYGIKAAAPAPKATGGDVVTTDGTYWYHAFKNSGTFVLTSVNSSLTVDILSVAGGGGGGGGAFDRGYGGGGGAGGLVYSASQTFTGTPYTVTVGAGGVGGLGLANPGINGTNSNITGGTLSLTAAVGGGGGGAFSYPSTAYSGGSGGGGGNNGGIAGSASPSGQGFAGGAGQDYQTGGYGNGLPGGGGGAGEAGNTDGQGAGGDGLVTYSSWASATGTGESGYYAGGGASGPGAAGGLGGGANGVGNILSNGNNGTAFTGGGGSNAGGKNPASTGGTGGSGIVIVRYAV